MDTSFYTAARGAIEQQKRMDVVANNLANTNNYGYKTKNAVFSDLMYYNMHNIDGGETQRKAGSGIVVEKTDTDFTPNAFVTTNGAYDYAIKGQGFFMLRNPQSGEIIYTRNGHFSLSQRDGQMYLVNDNGNLVLDENQNPITAGQGGLNGRIGVFGFNILDGMLNTGNNEFVPVEKNGAPFLVQGDVLQDHALESSGVNVADEMTRIIESQRAYSYALRMVQTSDEIVNTINSLRQ